MLTPDNSSQKIVLAVWNGEHTKRKFFNDYSTRDEAERVMHRLREFGIEAEILAVGETLALG